MIMSIVFALVVGTLIVPAGSKLIGQGLELAGELLQVHGRALGHAYREYMDEWSAYHWYKSPANYVDINLGEPSKWENSKGEPLDSDSVWADSKIDELLSSKQIVIKDSINSPLT